MAIIWPKRFKICTKNLQLVLKGIFNSIKGRSCKNIDKINISRDDQLYSPDRPGKDESGFFVLLLPGCRGSAALRIPVFKRLMARRQRVFIGHHFVNQSTGNTPFPDRYQPVLVGCRWVKILWRQSIHPRFDWLLGVHQIPLCAPGQ